MWHWAGIITRVHMLLNYWDQTKIKDIWGPESDVDLWTRNVSVMGYDFFSFFFWMEYF